MKIDVDELTRSLAARTDDAATPIGPQVWTALGPELRRRAGRRRRIHGVATAALALVSFAGGWQFAGLGGPATETSVPASEDDGALVPTAEDPLMAVQRSGAEFIASLAAIRGAAGVEHSNPRLRAYAEASGVTLLNGAATELARISGDDGLPAELARLSTPGRRSAAPNGGAP